MPMAMMITSTLPRPQKLTRAKMMKSAGRLSTMSTNRMSRLSTQPPT
jgi:hypothetical protein